jgi:hypothetical protein
VEWIFRRWASSLDQLGGLDAEDGTGAPTFSGVLAFLEVGFFRCADPILWVHPRFEGAFPRALNDLETRYASYAPEADPDVILRPATKTNALRNLGFVENR